ncbi:uncharacterized protein DS421_8g248270 [Arachis hypogaea]|nr:uncharacterized protein DS421_8g248270 [Arachis hypogaea]
MPLNPCPTFFLSELLSINQKVSSLSAWPPPSPVGVACLYRNHGVFRFHPSLTLLLWSVFSLTLFVCPSRSSSQCSSGSFSPSLSDFSLSYRERLKTQTG